MSEKVLYPSVLHIESFRKFKEIDINLGRRMTVISGQNGVGKSNIVSLIASGSGLSKKAILGSNFQPEFNYYFHINEDEPYSSYSLFLKYNSEDDDCLVKRLSFKNDTADARGIRIIPRTSNQYSGRNNTVSDEKKYVKTTFGIGADARIPNPTIYLSLARLYPLGELTDNVVINQVKKTTTLYKNGANELFAKWYNKVIPNAVNINGTLSTVKKQNCSRSSLYMDMKDIPILSQSIGQDNVGNIISALVDLYVLKQTSGFQTALLCIDEIDVSLHPDTQQRLFKFLCDIGEEYNIQYVFSTHSLTILKDALAKQKKNPKDFSVVYLKSQSTPYATVHKEYELLKADMFGQTAFKRNSPKLYVEDGRSKELLDLLFEAFIHIRSTVAAQPNERVLRNPDMNSVLVKNPKIIESSSGFKVRSIDASMKVCVTNVGCMNLLQLSKIDQYFKNIMILLDGDARSEKVKPRVKDYMDKPFDSKGVETIRHDPNIFFFPGFFAPESYLLRIINEFVDNDSLHFSFWRALDEADDTALFTSDKIRTYLSELGDDFDNDDVKKVFDKYNLWDFVKMSNLLTYYYSDYQNIDELLEFIKDLEKAYTVTKSNILQKKYL